MRFNDKPVARAAVRYRESDSDAEFAANIVADHIEEHLDRLGFIPKIAVRPMLAPVESVSVYSYDIDDEHYNEIRNVVTSVLDAHKRDVLRDVFSIDNPDNAIYDTDYAPVTSITQAISDGRWREDAFDLYEVGG